MKKKEVFVVVLILALTEIHIYSQDQNEVVKFNAGADFYSSYIFRGTRFGSSPALQPAVKLTSGNLTTGVWGSFDASGYSEVDPYFSYSLPFGLTLGLTDYYFPDEPLFDVTEEDGSHAFEINGGFSKWGLTLGANYIINEAGGAGSAGGDMYFQAGFSFTSLNIFVGAGDGWHTSDGEFDFCNIGIGTGKEIAITEKFSIPVTGLVIVNPDREQLFVVVGFSF